MRIAACLVVAPTTRANHEQIVRVFTKLP